MAIVADAEPPIPLPMIHRVNLSTGTVSPLPLEVEAPIGEMVFSNDAALVAVTSLPRRGEARTGQESPSPGVGIYETTSGSLLRHIGATEVVGFSDGGRRLLTAGPAANDPRLRVLSVIDWSSGEVLWTKQTSYGSWVTRPRSDDLIVADRSWRTVPAANRSQPMEDLWLIRSDGETVLAVRGASPLPE
ncbi:MAG: hypothetical protein ACP5QO_12120 [Clostridia bacterium]